MHGESDQMINVFINQIYEYILMGNLVSGFHKPSILLSQIIKPWHHIFLADLTLSLYFH